VATERARGLEGTVALITGGGTGIGAAVARRFAKDGARIVLLGPERGPLESVAAETGGEAVHGDAADRSVADAAVAMARERFGGLDALVTCAGVGMAGTLVDMPEDDWHASLHGNLDTCVVSCRAALPALVERGGGSIVIVSSVGGLTAGSQIASYATAKAGLLGLMRAIAVDYGPQGVRANAICPGWVETRMAAGAIGMFAESRGISTDEAWQRVNAAVPLRRPAQPAEIAAAIAFLASQDASFVTGSVLVTDGGQSAVNVGTVPFFMD
jgi:meso-butanediol dehydrogenase / (S,S)-butanediol dehydrogenase / diacetyl reductase